MKLSANRADSWAGMATLRIFALSSMKPEEIQTVKDATE